MTRSILCGPASHQFDLFPNGVIGRGLARTTDGGGSREAAEKIVASGQLGRECAVVLEALRAHPGLTSYELSVAGGLDRYTCGRRLSDLQHDGLAYSRHPRDFPDLLPCSITKIRAYRWWPTEQGFVKAAA